MGLFQYIMMEYAELRGEVKRNDSDHGIPAEEQYVMSYVKHTQHSPAVTAGKWISMSSYRRVILQLRVSPGDMLNIASCKFGWILIGAYVSQSKCSSSDPNTIVYLSHCFHSWGVDRA